MYIQSARQQQNYEQFIVHVLFLILTNVMTANHTQNIGSHLPAALQDLCLVIGALSSPKCWSGDIVRRYRYVWVEVDTRIVFVVKILGQGTCGIRAARSSDIDVEAEWIVLGTIKTATAVAGNDLMAEDVVA